MSDKTFFVARVATYLFMVGALSVGVWCAYPLVVEERAEVATVVLSAPLALYSSTIIQNSIELAFEEVRYRVGDMHIQLVVVDDGDESGAWIANKERRNAERAIADPTTIAYLGPVNSGAAKVSMPLLNTAGIAQISPSNTWPGLTRTGFLPGEPGIFYPTGKTHYFRVTPTDDLQGPLGVTWARALGHESVYVVNDSDAYGIGIANLFEHEAVQQGMHVVGSAAITKDAALFAPVGDAILASGADLVYYGGTTPNGGPELLRYLRARGATSTFMGPDGIFEQDFIDRAGTSSEGVLVTAVGVPPEEVKNPSAQAFLLAYRARFGSEPDAFGAFAYDATKALLAAIEKVGKVDRAGILEAVRATSAMPGVFGTWGFDAHGDTTLTLLSGNVITEGAFVFTKVLTAI
ncbi:MAG: hypothetical protein RLZZ234_788 [Candidatus Parcubacteria bacterium]|jgi:branched-chain amino acid transport system substrate-binding protein